MLRLFLSWRSWKQYVAGGTCTFLNCRQQICCSKKRGRQNIFVSVNAKLFYRIWMAKILKKSISHIQTSTGKVNFNTIPSYENFTKILLSLQPRIKTSVKTPWAVMKKKCWKIWWQIKTMFPSVSVITHNLEVNATWV